MNKSSRPLGNGDLLTRPGLAYMITRGGFAREFVERPVPSSGVPASRKLLSYQRPSTTMQALGLTKDVGDMSAAAHVDLMTVMRELDGAARRATRLGPAGFLLLLFGTIGAYAADVVGIPRILEGDFVEIDGRQFYLEGIDAPEAAQLCVNAKIEAWQCGKEAREQLIKKAGSRPWTCDMRGQDGLGRFLAACHVGGENIARWMVRFGWAISFKHCSRAYDAEQEEARRSRAGLWSGAFIAPRDWRNRSRFTTILGAVSVPVEAHKFLLPKHLPMDFEVRTPKPSCFPVTEERMSKASAVNRSVNTIASNNTASTEATIRGAAEPPVAAESKTKCEHDLRCLANKHAHEAMKVCERPVEQLATFDFRWIDTWYESRFDKVRWKNQSAGIITYIGDKIEYRDKLGHWVRHAYECDFDGITRRVLDVRAQPGQSVVRVR